MRLSPVDSAVETCQSHLESTGSFGSEIESFLTRHLTVRVCSAFEEEIERLLNERAAKSGDPALNAFCRSCSSVVFRSVQTSEIAGLLGRFGANYKQLFRDKMDANRQAETFFNNIISNRHDTAHGPGGNLTFNELVRFYENGHVVLDAFKEVLEATLP
jgi:hypothetical protein